jgi:hypothetical protein
LLETLGFVVRSESIRFSRREVFMSRQRLSSIVLAVGMIAAALPTSARADVVFGNLGASGTNSTTNTNTDVGPTVNNFLAQGFTAASPNLDVTSITLAVFGLSEGTIPATVGIYADNFGQPAASALYTSAVTNVGGKDNYVFSFTGAQLTAGSNYWVVPQTDVSWYLAASAPSAENGSGYNFTQTLENNAGGGWVSAASNRYGLSVQAVPEPSTFAIAAVGFAAAGFAGLRRRMVRSGR